MSQLILSKTLYKIRQKTLYQNQYQKNFSKIHLYCSHYIGCKRNQRESNKINNQSLLATPMTTERKYAPKFSGAFNSSAKANNSKMHQRAYSYDRSNKNSSRDFGETGIPVNNSVDLKNDSFMQTSQKLQCQSFRHHDSNLCVCSDCDCGRHLCKLHGVQKPSLSFTSSYRQSFTKKHHTPASVTKANEYAKLNGPHLQMKTMYGQKFAAKVAQKPQKSKGPDNWLASSGQDGAMCKLTSYSSGFPGFKGINQYVKPTIDQAKVGLSFQGTTTYGKSFLKPQNFLRQQASAKKPDNLGKKNGFLGNSCYRNQFKNPNPEDYSSRVKETVTKYVKDSNHSHQFETVYKSDFMKTRPTVCPAKVALQSKLKGAMSNSKGKFNENTDFKGMSPQFHAISTSKFY